MEDGLYAHNDDTGEIEGPFIEMDDAKEAAASWDGDEMIMIYDIVDERVEGAWEYEDGELMREPDLEGRDAVLDGTRLIIG